MPDAIIRLNTALEGRYRIERSLGEGGMATVYLARDLRHERKVALKVLKPELAAVVGAERFLAEIKTTANLQHPHILPLHDSGNADVFLFYVMPYVEGESLRQRLDRERQLPVEEAVRIATAVAHALDYAHRHGVIHRDIKPANILLEDGQPVISDFGIALAVTVGGAGRLTETGLSLGTPHYMSPEQATGDLSVGAAADIYALGCVLYEMLVGEPPYTGSTAQAVLGKIIAGEPASATKHRRSVPPNVDAAVRRALEKVPADRFMGAQDLTKALADPGFRHGADATVDGGAARRTWNPLPIGLGAVALAATVGLGWSLLRPVRPAAAPVRFTVRTPPGVNIGGWRGLAASPDGRSMIFGDDRTGQLYVRDVGRLDATPVPGTANAWYPFFSPDGEWVGYFDQAENTLRKTRVDGTQAQSLAPVPGTNRSAGWGPDGTIVLNAPDLGGLLRVRDTGGEPEPIAGAEGLSWIDLLPDGQAVLGHMILDRVPQVVAIRLETGERTVLFPGTTPRYVSSGHVVFWREGNLWAVRFDPERLVTLGAATPIAEGVPAQANLFGQYAVGGDLLFHGEAEGLSGRALAYVDRQGREEALGLELQRYQYPRLSPDGGRLAVVVAEDDLDIWAFDLDRGSRSRITFGGDNRFYPVWTPDGERLAYSDGNFDGNAIHSVPANGSGGSVALLERDGIQLPTSWSPDGDVLAFYEVRPQTGRDLWTLPLGGDPEPFLVTPFQERAPAFSPDGRWLAYVSDESGRDEIYVQPYPGPGPKTTVSTDGGREPVWCPDGSELFYRTGTHFMAVAVNLGDTFRAGTPQLLFDDPYVSDAGITGMPNYAIAPDCQRFVMVLARSSEGYSAAVVLHFVEELKRLVPE